MWVVNPDDAALALQRALQDAHVDVEATATVGGILDVEQWFLSLLARDNTTTLPLYASYLLLAYDDVYNVYGQTSDVFRQPYASTVGGLFDMQHFWDDVLAGLPPTSRALLTAAYYSRPGSRQCRALWPGSARSSSHQ
jgi:hypothetical protein